jgi:hypothetical protein
MPIYPPRRETVKKEEELLKRENELKYAVRNGHPKEKIHKAVEKYRKAQLSLLKAKLHVVKEKTYQKKATGNSLERIKKDVVQWKDISVAEILANLKFQ